MDLWESPKSPAIKEEVICKNECEVIIDIVEDGSEFYSQNYMNDKPLSCNDNESANLNCNEAKKLQRKKAIMRFGCMICDYKTANSTNFKIHLRTHTGEKPYKCDLCPYRAKVLCALYRHKRVHTGERPYACNICPYRAAQPSHLVRHKMIHTGERPHSCNLCSYKASQMSHLSRHMSVHTNYRPFPCNLCTYRAKRKSHLIKHLGTHEKERQLDTICSRQLRNINRNPLRYYDNDQHSTVNDKMNCKFCHDNDKTHDNKKMKKSIEEGEGEGEEEEKKQYSSDEDCDKENSDKLIDKDENSDGNSDKEKTPESNSI